MSSAFGAEEQAPSFNEYLESQGLITKEEREAIKHMNRIRDAAEKASIEQEKKAALAKAEEIARKVRNGTKG